MTVIRNLISASTALALLVGASPLAIAQAKSASLATAKPATASSWTCATRIVELAPVSFDTKGRPEGWVMVHRVKGEVVAAERVSDVEIEQIRRLPCQGDRLVAPTPLVG